MRHHFIFMFFFAIGTTMASHQNLLILLDQSGNHENVTNNFVSLTHELLAALQANCCSIVASSSIWHNILQKKREAAFALTQPKSPEIPTMILHAAINNRIADLFAQKKSKHAIANIIDAEFYSTAALQRLKQENKEASWAYTDFVVMHDFHFDADAWQVYWVNDRLLLFVPRKYLSKTRSFDTFLLSQKHSGCTESLSNIPCTLSNPSKLQSSEEGCIEGHTSQMHSFGLNVDQLQPVEDPCDLEALYLRSLSTKHEPFIKSLRKIFAKESHQWTIILEGHGRNNDEAPPSAGRIRYIADLSLTEYKEVLNFFNTEITTHLLLSGSCQSGGLLWQKMLKNKNDSFNFPIVLSCLTDITSYGYVIRPKLPFLIDKLLQEHDIYIDDNKKTAKLNIDYVYRYNDFFSTVAQIADFDAVGLQKLKTILPSIIEPHISNTPVFYSAHGTKSLLYDPATTLYVSENYTQPIVCNHETVLLDTPKISQSLLINSCNVPRIVSVMPGKAQHHLTSIALNHSSFDSVAQLFWPLKGLSVDKQFFIDRFVCLPGECLKTIAEKQTAVELNNVYVHVQKDAYMRLNFSYNDQVYSAHARLIDKQPVIKDLHAVRRMIPEQYNSVYASLQQKRKSVACSSIKVATARRRGMNIILA